MRDWESLDFHLHYVTDLKLFQFLSVESGFRLVSLALVSPCLQQTLDPVYPVAGPGQAGHDHRKHTSCIHIFDFPNFSKITTQIAFILFLHRLVFGHKFILKNERFKFKRTMFAKLFGVKEPFSSNCYIKARKEDALRLKQTRKRQNMCSYLAMCLCYTPLRHVTWSFSRLSDLRCMKGKN